MNWFQKMWDRGISKEIQKAEMETMVYLISMYTYRAFTNLIDQDMKAHYISKEKMQEEHNKLLKYIEEL